MPDWLSLVVAAVPIVLAAAFGTRQIVYSKRSRTVPEVPRGWVAAHGVVVDEESFGRRRRAKDGTRQRVRRPVITFQASDGREITFTSRIRAAGTPGVGALVEIYHDPFDPTVACIAPSALSNVSPSLGPADRLLILTVWIAAGVVGWIIGVVVLHA